MKALCVDDEIILLKSLKYAVEQSRDISQVAAFEDEIDALEYAENNKLDIAFLDIELHTMNGLTLAGKLREINPNIKIIFCTGHSRYALDSIQKHIVDGYLLKPITPEIVQLEIDYLNLNKNTNTPQFRIQCFGDFEVFYNNKPIAFKRSKTKELLALLVDRKGSLMSSRELCAILWEDSAEDKKNLTYIRQLFLDLNHTLNSIGLEKIIIKQTLGYAVDTSLINCDYYDYINNKNNSFLGEYMSQYTWAEVTLASLLNV